MALYLYFWIGAVLCIFAIMVLSYIVMCIRQYIHNNDHPNNKILNRFTMLISSDTVSTLVTGILLLVLGSKQHINSEERAITCTTSDLLLRLSMFSIPVLTGLASIPSWTFQSYKCTDCYIKNDNEEYQQKYLGKHWDKKSIIMVALQWIIPIITVLSMSMTEPEIVKFVHEELDNRNEMESFSMLKINMDETICDNHENIQLSPTIESRSYKQAPIENQTHITVSAVVDEIYNIVINHIKNNSSQKTLTHESPIDYKQENADSRPINNNQTYNNNITYKLNNIQSDNDTINIFNSIANTIQNNGNADKFLPKITDESYSTNNNTIQNNINNLNILKLMENFTRQNNKNSIVNTYNMTDILINDINGTNHTMCSMACQPSQIFLKYTLFLIIFINFFVPIIVTAVLRTLTNMNLNMLQLQEDNGINLKRRINNLSGRSTTIGLLTLSPTLLETTTRILLPITIPEIVSSSLLLTAMVGLVMRNLIGLHLINVIQNDGSTVHPLQQLTDNNTSNITNDNDIIVQEIESTSPQEAGSKK